MFYIFVQNDCFVQSSVFAVNNHPYIAAFGKFFKQFCPRAFLTTNNRCKNLNFCLQRKFKHFLTNLVNTHCNNGLATMWTIWHTDTCVQKTHIIINFGHSANGRPWIAICGFLVDRNCWRKTFDAFDIRFLNATQKLSGIR